MRIQNASSLLFCVLIFLFGITGLANFRAYARGHVASDCFTILSEDKPYAVGEELRVEVLAEAGEESPAAFRFSAEYDDTRLQYLRTEPDKQIRSGTFFPPEKDGAVCGLYLCKPDSGMEAAPPLEGTVVTLVFRVLDGAPRGLGALRVQIDQICFWDGNLAEGECAAEFTPNILPGSAATARLSNLEPGLGRLEPPFDPEGLEYQLSLPQEARELEFRADAEENGTVTVNRRTLKPPGETAVFLITVTSEDKKHRQTYTVRAAREKKPVQEPADVFLSSLVPSAGSLTPVFSPLETSYTLHVAPEVNIVTFAADAGENSVLASRYTLNRAGTQTTITLTVTSPDRISKKEYTVLVERAEPPEPEPPKEVFLLELLPSSGTLSPAFSPEETEYTLAVGAEINKVSFAAEPGENTLRVNRDTLGRAGTQTTITLTVLSPDKKSKKVYTVLVDRAEMPPGPEPEPPKEIFLDKLIPSKGELSPAFSREETEYTLSVAAEVNRVDFEAQAGENKVTASRYTLNPAGTSTRITLTVTSPDRKSKQLYVVVVERAGPPEPEPPKEVFLLGLLPSSGTLSPAFSPEETEYTLAVGAEINKVSFAAEPGENTLRVNRDTLGRAGTQTTITLTVLSPDKKSKKVYTVLVDRAEAPPGPEPEPPKVIYLDELVPSKGKLSPAFSREETEYTLSVAAGVSSVDFETQAGENKVTVSRRTLNPAGTSTRITLTVTSPDRKSKQLYVVVVERAEVVQEIVELKEAFLTELASPVGQLSPAFSPGLTQYVLDVGAETNDVVFQMKAGDGGFAEQDRHRLKGEGETTQILITATSADRKDRLVYTVLVNRETEVPQEAAQFPPPLLTKLAPSQGKLVPAFSPTGMDYQVEVGAGVQELTFETDSGGAAVDISRKKLYRAGESTKITITVTSADKLQNTVYSVLVYRAPETEEYTPSSPAKAASGSSAPKKNDSASQAQKPEEKGDFIQQEQEKEAETAPVQTAAAPGKNLYVEGDRLDGFVTGAVTAVVCVLLGGFLGRAGKRQKGRDKEDGKEGEEDEKQK